MKLPNLYHLSHLLIANEDFVNLEDSLFEHEVDGVLKDLL